MNGMIIFLFPSQVPVAKWNVKSVPFKNFGEIRYYFMKVSGF
jgi:hypothetical protein